MSTARPTEVELMEGAILLERVRATAYDLAGRSGRLGAAARERCERFAAHERAHADALRTGLEALGGGLDPPEQLEPSVVAEVIEALAAAGDEEGTLRVLARLERVAIDAYARAQRDLPAPELRRTVATVMASHAQHLAVLRAALGEESV